MFVPEGTHPPVYVVLSVKERVNHGGVSVGNDQHRGEEGEEIEEPVVDYRYMIGILLKLQRRGRRG